MTQGQLVVQGVLNPKTIPIDPSRYWLGRLNGCCPKVVSPSFGQIAAGGSVNWNGGASTTTQTAATQAQMTATANPLVQLRSQQKLCILPEAQWEGKGLRVGMSYIQDNPAGTVVTQIIDYNLYYFVRFNNRHTGIERGGQAVDFALGGDPTGTNCTWILQTWEAQVQ